MQTQTTRKFEAFLVQVLLIEGLLCELSLQSMGKDFPCVYGKRRTRYGIDNAINDLYLLKIINDEEFKALESYKNKRNDYFHDILRKKFSDLDSLEKDFEEDYLKGEDIIQFLRDKLN